MDFTCLSLSIANDLLARAMDFMRLTSWFDAGACAAIINLSSLPRRRTSAGRMMVMHFSGSLWSGMMSAAILPRWAGPPDRRRRQIHGGPVLKEMCGPAGAPGCGGRGRPNTANIRRYNGAPVALAGKPAQMNASDMAQTLQLSFPTAQRGGGIVQLKKNHVQHIGIRRGIAPGFHDGAIEDR